MAIIFQLLTHIPERGLVVSTVNHDMEIGWKRTAETMVFPANESGEIADFTEVRCDSHGIQPSEETLKSEHERICAEVRAEVSK